MPKGRAPRMTCRTTPNGQRRAAGACRPRRGSRPTGLPARRACSPLSSRSQQDGGGELRRGGERNEADGDQGVGLADEPEIEIPQQEDQQDAAAPHDQQQPAHVVLAQEPEPQEDGHEQVVAEHGGERDRLDDDHARGRGQAADEHEQGQRLLADPQGSVRTNMSASTVPARKKMSPPSAMGGRTG